MVSLRLASFHDLVRSLPKRYSWCSTITESHKKWANEAYCSIYPYAVKHLGWTKYPGSTKVGHFLISFRFANFRMHEFGKSDAMANVIHSKAKCYLQETHSRKVKQINCIHKAGSKNSLPLVIDRVLEDLGMWKSPSNFNHLWGSS